MIRDEQCRKRLRDKIAALKMSQAEVRWLNKMNNEEEILKSMNFKC